MIRHTENRMVFKGNNKGSQKTVNGNEAFKWKYKDGNVILTYKSGFCKCFALVRDKLIFSWMGNDSDNRLSSSDFQEEYEKIN